MKFTKLIALLFLIPLAFVACGEDEKTFTEKNYLVVLLQMMFIKY
jgi:hypothetical protein